MKKIYGKFISQEMTTDDELQQSFIHVVAELFEVFVKGSRTATSQEVTNGYFDISFPVVPKTLKFYKGRLRLHEDVDYTVTLVNPDKTRVTFIGEVAAGQSEAILANDELVYYYKYSYGEVMAAYRKHYKELTSQDITNGYVDLPHEAKINSVIASIGRLGMFESIDYDLSSEGGVTRVTFKGDLLPTGSTPLVVGNVVFFEYQL